MSHVAVLDANVLWPQYLRDVLIRLARADLYRAVWSEQILDEMSRSLIARGRVHPHISRVLASGSPPRMAIQVDLHNLAMYG